MSGHILSVMTPETEEAPRTQINFLGGTTTIVDGSPDEIAKELRGQGSDPVCLTTPEGSALFINWANVLYLESARPPA